MRCIAVDWSGKREGEGEAIWLAEVVDEELVCLRNGFSREAVVAELERRVGADDRQAVVGLDFCFSCPRWWCEERGWSTAREVWQGMSDHGEELLARCEPPLWGRAGRRKPPPHPGRSPHRATELEPGCKGAKSVFQIGGAGAVGTGSMRGMPQLLRLEELGFHVWPFSTGWPRVLEIYPRALTGPVRKSRWQARHEHLRKHFPDQREPLLERAAGSEDAFDAAVSALVMSRHAAELGRLETPTDPTAQLEGRIWLPPSP